MDVPDKNNNTETGCENTADAHRTDRQINSSTYMQPVFNKENDIHKVGNQASSGDITIEESNFPKEESMDVSDGNEKTDSSAHVQPPAFNEENDIHKVGNQAGSGDITIEESNFQKEESMDVSDENEKTDSIAYVQPPAFNEENDIHKVGNQASSGDITIEDINFQKETKMDTPDENKNTETRRESTVNIHRVDGKTDSSTLVQSAFEEESNGMVDSQASSGNITIKNINFQKEQEEQKEKKMVAQTSGTINWDGKGISLKGSCASLSYLNSRTQQDRLLLPYVIEKGAMQGQVLAAVFSGINGDDRIAEYMKSKFSDRSSKTSLCKVKPEMLDSEGRLKTHVFETQGSGLEEKEKEQGIDFNRRSLFSGSTMSLLNITPEGKLHISTMGDSRVMIFQDGKCRFTSFDMSVSDCMAASSLVCNIVPDVKENRLYAVDFTKNRQSLIETVTKGITTENSKYFTDKYGEISPDVLAELCINHLERRQYMEKVAGAAIVENFGRHQFQNAGDPAGRWSGGSCDADVCNAWGLRSLFSQYDAERFHPAVKTCDLSVLDENKPIQIVIGSRIFTEPFDDDIDEIGKIIGNSEQTDLPYKVKAMAQASLDGRSNKKLDTRKNMAVTVMELNIKKYKK